MKTKDFVLNCTTRQFVILLDCLDNYRSILEDSLIILESESKNFSVLTDVQVLSDKLQNLI